MNKKTVIAQTINSLLSIADELDKSKNYDEADTLTKIASNIIKKTQRTAEPMNGYGQSSDLAEASGDKLSQINNFLHSMSSDDFYNWADTPKGKMILQEKDRLETQQAYNPMDNVPVDSASDYGSDDMDNTDYAGGNVDNLNDDNDYVDANGFQDDMHEEDPFLRGHGRASMDEVDNDPHAQYFK